LTKTDAEIQREREDECMVDKAPETECIVMREYEERRDRQVDIPYEDTAETIQMRKKLCRYNNLLRRTFIDIPEFPREGIRPEKGNKLITLNRANKFVRRIFNNKSWDDGGRFNARGGRTFQRSGETRSE
jgi:hypothetical protein